MASSILAPTVLALTTTLTDIPNTPVTGSKVRRYDVRATNVGAADAYVNLVLTDGTTVINRAKNFPVPYQTSGSAPDLENGLVVPTGWKLRASASASSVVEISVTQIEDDA